MSEPTYDPETCVKAGELRAAGIPVSDDIPDCGWIPRASIRQEVVGVTGVDRQLTVHLTVTFEEPFRSIHIEGTVNI